MLFYQFWELLGKLNRDISIVLYQNFTKNYPNAQVWQNILIGGTSNTPSLLLRQEVSPHKQQILWSFRTCRWDNLFPSSYYLSAFPKDCLPFRSRSFNYDDLCLSSPLSDNFKIQTNEGGCKASMQSRRNLKHPSNPTPKSRHKKVASKQPQPKKITNPKQTTTNPKLKPPPSKKSSNLQQPSFTNLFNSARDLFHHAKKRTLLPQRQSKQSLKEGSTSNKYEESTASRQFKLRGKIYSDPNGQYFGSKVSIKGGKQVSSKKERQKAIAQLTRSLRKKIHTLRKVEVEQESESQSMKSEISQQEMKRLKKIHSTERMRLMHDIITAEEQRLLLTHKK